MRLRRTRHGQTDDFAGSLPVYGLVLPEIIRALTLSLSVFVYAGEFMTLLDALSRPELWEAFYQYKTGLVCAKAEEKSLRSYLDRRAYEPVCAAIRGGEALPLPRRAVISKLHSGKKRVVYVYPEPQNTVFKLLTWLLLRRYDSLFSAGRPLFVPSRQNGEGRDPCPAGSSEPAGSVRL